MKTILKVAAAVAGFAVLMPLQANATSGYIDQALVEVCTNAKNDDVIGLHQTLRGYRMTKKVAAQKVMCNQQWLVSFARSHQAQRVVNMLERYELPPERRVTITDISPAAN